MQISIKTNPSYAYKQEEDEKMYAIIKCGGKQYKVSEGDIIDIDYTGKAAKETLEITDVLAVNNGELKTGAAVANAKVEAVVVLDGTGVNRARKVVIYKKRRRKDSKLKRGFRKSLTKVRITKIEEKKKNQI